MPLIHCPAELSLFLKLISQKQDTINLAKEASHHFLMSHSMRILLPTFLFVIDQAAGAANASEDATGLLQSLRC